MTEDFFLCHTDIYVGTLRKQIGRLGGVVEDEERHNDVACHVVETAGQEVVNGLVVGFLHLVDGCLVEVCQLGYTGLQCLQIVTDLALQHLLDDVEVGAVGDVADGCYYLQLGGTLVDREDAGITEQALTLVLHDETGTSVDADGIVGVLVGIL